MLNVYSKSVVVEYKNKIIQLSLNDTPSLPLSNGELIIQITYMSNIFCLYITIFTGHIIINRNLFFFSGYLCKCCKVAVVKLE